MTSRIDAATIIRALGGDVASGMCQCPAHDDKKPSLKISDGQSGKVLVKCFAGCTQEAVIDALQARRVWDAGHRNARAEPEKRSHDSNNARDELLRFHHAHKILRAAALSGAGKPTDYLRGRAINLVPECAMILPPEKSLQYTGKRFPAMVCTITDGDFLIGAHVTCSPRV